MAKLDPAFVLADLDASSVTGLRSYEGNSSTLPSSSSYSLVVVTTGRRVLVVDVATRRVARSFTLTEEGENFASAAFVESKEYGVLHLHCVVGDHLWIWRLDASDLKSCLAKIPLPFRAVDAAPIPGGDGVALRSADGQACLVVGRDRRVVQVGQRETPSSSPSSSDIFEGRSAVLHLEAGGARFRLFDYGAQIVDSVAPLEPLTITATAATLLRLFLRRRSICIVEGGNLTEFALRASECDLDPRVGRKKNQITLEKESSVVWIHPDKDVFFCLSPHSSSSPSSSSSLQMRSLKFNTIFSSRPFDSDFSSPNFSAICCLVGDTFCVTDGHRLSAYPFVFPTSSSYLSSNFGKRRDLTTEAAQHTVNGVESVDAAVEANVVGGAGAWHRHKKRNLISAGATTAARRHQDTSTIASMKLAASLKLAASSAVDEASLLNHLRRGDAAATPSKTEMGKMFETLVDLLAERTKQSTGGGVESFWPDQLFRFLMSSSVINRWNSVIDVLLQRADLSIMDFALRQPGIDDLNLCRLLRFLASLPEDSNLEKMEDDDDATARDPSVSSSFVTKRQLLLRVVSSPIRDENVKGALKTFSLGDVVDILETLVELSKERTKEELEAEEEEEGVNGKTEFAPPLPRAALLHWMTLLIDSHFVEFILGEDERRIRLLRQVESLVQDVEAYFHTRDALDGLLDKMRQKSWLSGCGKALKTSMGPDEDYCIQIMEI